MSIYRYESKEPRIGKNCYVSDSARVIGAVTIGDGCYIGHGAIIRGDYGVVKIGKRTAVEEGVVIHARFEKTAVIGDHVTLGHSAVMHGERLDDYAVVGMGAIIGRDAVIGKWAIVAEGAVVPTGRVVEKENIVTGIPAKSIGMVSEKHKDYWRWAKQLYFNLAREYYRKLEKIG